MRSDEPKQSRDDGVAHAGVGEAFDQRALVVGQVDARHRQQRRRRLGIHVVEQEFGEQRVTRGVVHQPVAGQVGEVAEALMAGVEQSQLHQLVRRDVVDEQHVDVLERRPAVGEVVLEHPRGERLGGDGPLVLDAEFGCQRSR